jgi:adenylosuccinate synthase
MMVDVILGLQWGDEGKGKIVDVLAPQYDIIARFQGGPNAGHTIEFDKRKFILHTIPSGIFHGSKLNVIGNGVIIDPFIFSKEIEKLKEAGIDPWKNLVISRRAHLIVPTHRLLDAAYEQAKGKSKIGSTLKGIGPAYTDKTARNGLRVGTVLQKDFMECYEKLRSAHTTILGFLGFDLENHLLDGMPYRDYEQKWLASIDLLKEFPLVETEELINRKLDEGKTVLAEGAQGSLLDVDFGSYPYVTSSTTISAGVCAGLGVSPHRIGRIYGVFKSYCTRVGEGPFPTELKDATGDMLRDEGREFGSTTGRPRRCGWLDLPALRYSVMLNGVDSLVMMKADVLSCMPKIRVCTGYRENGVSISSFPSDLSALSLEMEYDELDGWNVPLRNASSFDDLPATFAEYIRYIEKALGLPVDIVSLGPDRMHTLSKKAL